MGRHASSEPEPQRIGLDPNIPAWGRFLAAMVVIMALVMDLAALGAWLG